MSRLFHRRVPVQRAALLGLTSLVTLSGCATFGSNVRGSFSCEAPDGICAPSSTIDDRALALISGAEGDASPMPAGGRENPVRASRLRTESAAPVRVAPADPGRSQEKVLRIVFQPYIDERGRLHEAGAVHAVVATGDWQSGPTAVLGTAPQNVNPATGSQLSLAAAVDRVDPPLTDAPAVDPTLPDPAAIEAARARKVDPVEAIKADVSSRLTATGRSGARAAPSLARPAAPPAPVLAKPSAGVSAAIGAAQGSGAAAAARVKADPRVQSIGDGAAAQARAAASGAIPAAAPAPGKTVKAESFPAAVPESD